MFHFLKGTSHDHLELERGLWWPVQDGDKRSVIISCPGCGETHSLRKEIWTIAADGAVTPSVDHSQPIKRTGGLPDLPSHCTFHSHVFLEGWAT